MIDLMLRRMIVLLLIFLPLFFIPQAYNKYELAKVLLFRAYVDLIFIILIFKILSQKRPIVKSPLLSWGKVGVAAGVFLGVSYLASVLGVDFGQSILGTYFRNQGMITMLHYAMFFVILSSLEKEDFEAIFNGLLGGAMLVAFLVLVQFILVRLTGEAIGRYHLTFGNPNFLGAYLAICMPIGVWRALKDKRIWAGVILMMVGIVLSGSRGAMGGGAVGAGLVGLSYLRSLGYLSKIMIGITAVVIIVFLYANNRGSLYEDRLTIWGAGVRAFGQRPVLGWGVENFEYAYKAVVREPWLLDVKVDKAHNEIIEVMVASGLAGVLAYLFLLGIIFKYLNNPGRVVLASFIVLSLTNVLSITAYIVFWVLAGMAAVNEQNRKEFLVSKAALVLMAVICAYLLYINIENVWRDIMLRNDLGNFSSSLSTS